MQLSAQRQAGMILCPLQFSEIKLFLDEYGIVDRLFYTEAFMELDRQYIIYKNKVTDGK